MWQPRIANVRHRTGTTARPVVAPVNLIEISASSSLLFLSRQKPMVFGDRPIFCLATVSYRASPWTIPPSCSIPLRDIVHLLLPRIFFFAEFSTCSINFSPFREMKHLDDVKFFDRTKLVLYDISSKKNWNWRNRMENASSLSLSLEW